MSFSNVYTLSSRYSTFFGNSDMEKVMATHSSTLAWKISWMEGPSGLQSMGC